MTDPHFRFGLQTEGTAGAGDFALWVALENHSGQEIALTRGGFSIGTQLGNGWVSMPLTPAEPFPFGPLAPGQSLRISLHRGAGLPLAESHADWAEASGHYAHGASFPWRRCRTMADLMEIDLCELDIGIELRLEDGTLRQLGGAMLNTKLAEGRRTPPARVELKDGPQASGPYGRPATPLSGFQRVSIVTCVALVVLYILTHLVR